MDMLVTALREHQELAIFFALAAWFFIGRIKIGSFSLGTVVGTLLAGDMDQADDIFADAVEESERAGALPGASVALAERSLLAMAGGEGATLAGARAYRITVGVELGNRRRGGAATRGDWRGS